MDKLGGEKTTGRRV